jgi:uncharacterized protein with HEPN domain
MRSDIERLKDIGEAVAAIEKYAVRGRDAFEKDELIQTWILHHLLILGEATAKVSDEFKEKHTEIPWSKVVGMRNILVHNYFGIDFDVVWGVVESDLPQLKKLLGRIV